MMVYSKYAYLQEHYTQFCSHITCEAMYNENLVPVTNRRCLCELSKEMGFLEEAQKIFTLEQQLCTFRHIVSLFFKSIFIYSFIFERSSRKW